MDEKKILATMKDIGVELHKINRMLSRIEKKLMPDDDRQEETSDD